MKLQNKQNKTEQDLNLLTRTQEDLDSLILGRTKGAVFRSKAKWYNDSERGTKYFLNLERSRSNSKNVSCVLKENGELITKPYEILKEQERFYSKLYKSDPSVSFDIKNDTDLFLTEEEKNSAEGPFTKNEIVCAIKQMARNKTPGCDGLSIEFYITFWQRLENTFYEALLYAYQKKDLHDSAFRGVISLIPKKGRDSRIIRNMRPITLLNTDYKIIEKILANRLKPLLTRLINEDQKGFMSGRNINCNIRRVMDLIEYSETHDLPGIIVSLDFEKCFDRIEVKALIGALEFFNFGPSFIKWTELIYSRPVACISNNGYFSNYFNVKRSVKQGGCCSAYYFLIIAEVLAMNLRKDGTGIVGFTVNDIHKIFGQFADDIDLYLHGDQKSLQKSMQIIEHFCQNTGFKINYDKTTVYRIGSLKKSDIQFVTQKKLCWTSKPINVLGINVQHDITSLGELNFPDTITKVRAVCNNWKSRGISLAGKVLIVNTLIASLFVYKMSVLPKISSNYVKELNTIIQNFIWDGKKPKIPLQILQANIEQGGMKLINFEVKDDSLKINWVHLLTTDSFLAVLAYQALNEKIGVEIFQCNISEVDIKMEFKETFWRDVLCAWSKVNYQTVEEIVDPSDIGAQPIWCNSCIRIENKMIFNEHLYRKGLMYISQLTDNNTTGMLSANELSAKFDVNVMTVNQILSAIPKMWQKILRENSCHHADQIIAIKKEKLKESKKYYAILNNCDDILLKCFRKWQKKMGVDSVEFCDYADAFANITAVTNVGKLRSFQYRFLHCAIILNDVLIHWKLKPSNKCTWCNIEKETQLHFFWSCDKIQEFWESIAELCQNISNVRPNITLANICLNKIDNNPKHVNNFICLAAKRYMYAQRCKQESLSKYEFERLIYKYQQYEKYNAQVSNTLHKHKKKWFLDEIINSQE